MAPFIFGKRNLIHIIDIRETVKGLLRAKRFIAQTASRGEYVLFVGTKRQARHTIEHHAKRVGMPYVSERWLGGMLTNFRTVRSRLGRLEELERERDDGSAQQYGNKAIATRDRELRKIHRNLSGVREMSEPPGALVVVDVTRERIAVREAKKLGIPTICLLDTDSDPDYADIPIPGNDDAIRSIEVIIEHLADAVEAGKRARPAGDEDARSQRRRSSRPAMGRAEEDAPADEGAPANVPEHGVEVEVQPTEPAAVEPAPSDPPPPPSDAITDAGDAPIQGPASETTVS